MGLATNDFASEGGGVNVKAFADFFAEEAVILGVGEDFGVGNNALNGGQFFEGVAKFVGARCTFLFRWFRISRRSFLGVGGGGLFCFILQESHQELVGVELFALGSVELL